MATSPEKQPDFRAPPPSPIATGSGQKSAAVNDEALTEFLEHSLHVPELILPDHFFPREDLVQNPLEIDFQWLISSESSSVEKLLESVAGIGCFQVVNHGISGDLIGSLMAAGKGLFLLSPEKKMLVARSPENPYGFEEFSGEETEVCEEFFWRRNEGRCGTSVLQQAWPEGFQNFSRKIELLSTEAEEAAGKVLQILRKNTLKASLSEVKTDHGESESVVCLYKHCRKMPAGRCVSSLKSDVVRMLIRKSDYSHEICMHFCDGSSEFHIYSKKGWVSFVPSPRAIVFTVGDQIQAWSCGVYKQVIGRPIFHMEEEDSISIAFLYSPPQHSIASCEKTISLSDQVIIAVCLTVLYHFLLYVYKII